MFRLLVFLVSLGVRAIRAICRSRAELVIENLALRQQVTALKRVVHFNATFNPTAPWVIQQLREAFPYDTAPRHLIFDGDSIFCPKVVRFVKAMGTKPRRISYRSPWQNPVAERWTGSCRRELLEHVVVLGERHLVRLLCSYLNYYHEDRCHLGLDKDAPNARPVTPRPSSTAKVVALPRVGGVHHRYEWRQAA